MIFQTESGQSPAIIELKNGPQEEDASRPPNLIICDNIAKLLTNILDIVQDQIPSLALFSDERQGKNAHRPARG